MADPYDALKDPTKHKAPSKKAIDTVIELALRAGGGMTTLLSGLLAAVLIMYSGYVLYDTFATERAASSNAWDLLQFKPEIFDDYETPLTGADLAEINKDYRAWLTVYGTPIDYPVMQGTNDLYYASHDIYDRVSLTGAIYLAAGNRGDFSDSYNVIYGHHMDNGAMFGSLDHMNGKETGIIITRDAIYDVEFFAVINTDAYESNVYMVGDRKDAVLAFLRSGGAGGVGLGTQVIYFNEAIAAAADKIVALSTCANANTSGRLVVFGRMVRRNYQKDLTIRKVWEDENDLAGLRPDSLTVYLMGDGRVAGTAVLTPANNWRATIRNVPIYADGGEVTYRWVEADVEGYRQTAIRTTGDTTTIVNTLDVPEDEEEYTLTIFYRFLDGSTAAPTITGVYWEGDPYDILSPEIEGYKATLLRVTGTMPARNVEYTVIYIPEDFTLIDNFDTPLGLGQVNVNVGDCLE